MSDHAEQVAAPVPGVRVFSTPGCVQCKATFRALDAAGIPYEPFDVAADAIAAEQARELGADLMTSGGRLQMPLVVTPDGRTWAGYSPDKIKAYAASGALVDDVPHQRGLVAADRSAAGQVVDRGLGSVEVAGVRRPAQRGTDDPETLWVSPTSSAPYRAATADERATFVPGDAYPGTTKQRWWNAALDDPAPSSHHVQEGVGVRARALAAAPAASGGGDDPPPGFHLSPARQVG